MRKLTILLILLFIPTLASAGSITLTTTITIGVLTDTSTTAHLKILNSGDESAYDVRASLVLPEGLESDNIIVGELMPNKPFEGEFEITRTKEILSGKHPVVVIIDYTDASGYPFSIVSPAFIIYKNQTSSLGSGLLSDVTLYGKASSQLKLTIRNLDDVTHTINIELTLPRELKVDKKTESLSIDAKGEKELFFTISSLSALPKSRYIILASVAYENGGMLYSSFANGTVNIEEEKPSNLPSQIFIASFVILLIIFIYYYLIRGRR